MATSKDCGTCEGTGMDVRDGENGVELRTCRTCKGSGKLDPPPAARTSVTKGGQPKTRTA